MEETKVHYKDVQVITGRDEKEYFKVEGGQWSLDADYIRRQACTHMDCKICSKEMLKNWSMKCADCQQVETKAKYDSLPLVEWNGSDALFDFNSDDTYFFDLESIEEYCVDNEINKEDLLLVICGRTSFNQIDVCELQQEVVHEDWEPEEKLSELIDALNGYLAKASTRTWLPSDQRVSLKTSDIV
jgi:hypothetical protein